MGQKSPIVPKLVETPVAEAPVEINYGPLSTRLSYVVRRAQLAISQDFFEAMAEWQISPVQFSALVLIANNPGLIQTQVSDALGVKKANFVGLVRELEMRKLVERRPTASDRRAYALHLTERGKTAYQALDSLSARQEQAIQDLIGPEAYASLMEPLRRLARMKDQSGIPAEIA